MLVARNVTFLLLLVEAPGWNLAWNWGSSRGAEDFHEPINGGTIQQCFVSDLEHGYGVRSSARLSLLFHRMHVVNCSGV